LDGLSDKHFLSDSQNLTQRTSRTERKQKILPGRN